MEENCFTMWCWFLHVCFSAQSCPTLVNPWLSPARLLSMWILQAGILEWVVMPSSRRTSQCRDWTQVSCIAGGCFAISATREALFLPYNNAKSAIIMHTVPSSWASLLLPHPSPLGNHRAPSWAPCFPQQLLTSYLFYTWERVYTYMSMPLSPFIPFSPSLPVSTSNFFSFLHYQRVFLI